MSVVKNDFVSGLIEQHGWNLVRFLSARLRRQDAEDVAQQTYLHLLQHPAPGEISNPAAYLYRTAANLAIDALRRENTRLRFTETEADPDTLATSMPSPESALDSNTRLRRFNAVIEELPELCRHAFILNKLDGLTHSEIAEQLGLSKKTVQRYILKAIEHCATRLDP
ncbi:MAG: sigma-70 family RNA polymerase sigma factor [Gammaproteobacteria bacterium]|nr:sigma-70 family RNA polymerase sigma factor [Gammaproteobacteria bacterium]